MRDWDKWEKFYQKKPHTVKNNKFFFSQITFGPGFAANALVLTCIAILIYIRIRSMYWYKDDDSSKSMKIIFVPGLLVLVMFLLTQFISIYPYHVSLLISAFFCLFSFSIVIPLIMIFTHPSRKFKLFVKLEELYLIFVWINIVPIYVK